MEGQEKQPVYEQYPQEFSIHKGNNKVRNNFKIITTFLNYNK